MWISISLLLPIGYFETKAIMIHEKIYTNDYFTREFSKEAHEKALKRELLTDRHIEAIDLEEIYKNKKLKLYEQLILSLFLILTASGFFIFLLSDKRLNKSNIS